MRQEVVFEEGGVDCVLDMRVVVCCSVLQCVASMNSPWFFVYYGGSSVLQCVAVWRSVVDMRSRNQKMELYCAIFCLTRNFIT